MNGRNEKDIPGVVAPPPAIYGGAIGLGVALQYLAPAAVVSRQVQAPLGILLILAAAVLMWLSMREFQRAQTSVRVDTPTARIVTTGPYRFTRNPIYVSLTLLHLGVAIWVNSAWVLGMLVPALLLISSGVIAREEQYLARRFGEEYLRYTRSVRRWL
jgi:protein-S-isoprenylcysteine O-methyltransferase Ste14